MNRNPNSFNSTATATHKRMKFKFNQLMLSLLPSTSRLSHNRRLHFTLLVNKLRSVQPRAFLFSGGATTNSSSKGNWFMVPGATAATLLMLGALHARRLYEDKKIEESHRRGIELEFKPDVKATFMRFLPLRSISRCWGCLTSVEIPVWMRPHVYKAWARAFHSNLDEASLPLDRYASLRDFFIRSLKEGSRPVDTDPQCVVSPVDGTVLRFGEIKGAGAMIEQVKGFSYSALSLLGRNSVLPMVKDGTHSEDNNSDDNAPITDKKRSWLNVSLASPKVRDPVERPVKGLFYCVLYLGLGDYHRVHSPVDWNVSVRRHFPGRLFPVNERAARTIGNLYIENERVVLEGQWREGFMAMAAVGATNIGSINLLIEPELRTNQPVNNNVLFNSKPEERVYEPLDTGIPLRKGDEVAAFNMGSTVVLIFQAPVSKSPEKAPSSSNFNFCLKRGDRIRVGEAIGRYRDPQDRFADTPDLFDEFLIWLDGVWVLLTSTERRRGGDGFRFIHTSHCFQS